MDMRIQKTLLLISLLLVVMYSCKNTNSNDKIEQAKDSIVNIASDDIVLNNPLAGKKFYYLEKDKTGTLILKKYPQFEGDFEMQKIIFTDSMLIDGWNVMEPYEWNIVKIANKSPKLIYYVEMGDVETDDSSRDTLYFRYDNETGFLYNILENTTLILIDSLHSDKVKTKKVKVKDD